MPLYFFLENCERVVLGVEAEQEQQERKGLEMASDKDRNRDYLGSYTAATVAVGSSGLAAAGVLGPLGILAALGGGVVTGAVMATIDDIKPWSLGAGALTGAAVAFAAAQLGATSPEAPAAPEAAAPATTLVAEGNCRQIETRLAGSDGRRVEVILPPGCALKP